MKKSISFLILVSIISGGLCSSPITVQAAENSVNSVTIETKISQGNTTSLQESSVNPAISETAIKQDDTKSLQKIGTLSDEDKAAAEAKLKLADEYIKNKNKNKKQDKSLASSAVTLNGYGSTNVMYYPYNAQLYGNYCGPASAYNSIIGKKPSLSSEVTQTTLAADLGVIPGAGGTNLPGSWKYALNKYVWENNYQILMGSSYGSTSDWINKVRNSIIYTVDKGYPVIVDTEMIPYGPKIHPSNYAYIDARGLGGAATHHYIAVTGYDNTSGTDSAFYSDSLAAAPGRYWCSMTNIGQVSKPMGIIW